MIVKVKSEDPAFPDGEFSHIECDVEDCKRRTPPSSEVLKAGGIIALGWYAKGGKHRCPDHFDADAPMRALELREQ